MITVLLPSPALDVTYLVDRVEVGAIHRPREVLRAPGGKGLNLARAAHRLGAAATVVAPLGGHIGALVASLAQKEGVTITAVDVAAETRSCVTVVSGDAHQTGLTEFYEPAAGLDADEQGRIVEALRTSPPGEWTTLAGSVPVGLDLSLLVEALRSRVARGDRLAIDTHGAALDTLIDELQPALVKVNRHEAAALLGWDGDAAALAAAVRARSGGTVVITDGSNGSVGIDETGAWRARLDAPAGRYPVGSGDSYLAGLLVALSGGAALPEALAAASGAAAANAQVPGAATFDSALARELTVRTTVTRA